MYLMPGPPLYYGAVAGLVAWQVAFFIIATDPVRFRPLMFGAMCEKLLWLLTLWLLFARGRVSAVDLVMFTPTSTALLVFFVLAYRRTPGSDVHRDLP